MASSPGNKLIDAIVGVIISAVGGVALIWAELVPWNPGVKPWLIAGGVFGLLVGVSAALSKWFSIQAVMTWCEKFRFGRGIGLAVWIGIGLLGTLALWGLNRVIDFAQAIAWFQLWMAVLAFFTAAALFYLGTTLKALLNSMPKEVSE